MIKLPLFEKYKPVKPSEIFQSKDISIIKNIIKTKNLQTLILYGPPGTGKTTAANIIINKLFKDENIYYDSILELNASIDRGIDVIKNRIADFVGLSASEKVGFKVVLLDESDALTKQAQNSLRRIIEKNHKTTKFIFICNYIDKIISPIISRCISIKFDKLENDKIYENLKRVKDAENIDIDDDTLEYIVNKSNGDMRMGLILLQNETYKDDFIKEMKKTNKIIIKNKLKGVFEEKNKRELLKYAKWFYNSNIDIEEINEYIKVDKSICIHSYSDYIKILENPKIYHPITYFYFLSVINKIGKLN